MCTIGQICNRCTGCVAMATLWKCVAERSGNPPGPPHACRTRTLRMPAKTPLACDNIDASAACAVPFRPYCGGVVTRTRNVSEYMIVLALCLVAYINRNFLRGITSNIIVKSRHKLRVRVFNCKIKTLPLKMLLQHAITLLLR